MHLHGGVSIIALLAGTSFAFGLALGLLFWHHAGGLPFWTGVFSDAGSPSFSRVSCAFCLIVCFGWISFEVWETTPLADVEALIRALTPFLASTLGLLYGVNKIGAMVAAGKANGTAPRPSTPPAPQGAP